MGYTRQKQRQKNGMPRAITAHQQFPCTSEACRAARQLLQWRRGEIRSRQRMVAMSASNPFAPGNAMELGKQFWDAWTEFAQTQAGRAQGAAPTFGFPGTPAGSPGAASMPNWHEGLELWSRLTGANASGDAANAIAQMTAHGQRMLQMMQAMANRSADGKTPDAADVASAWKDMLGGSNPMLDTLRGLSGQGAQGWEQMARGMAPMLSALREERDSWLGMPALGYNRERQQQHQAILQAQAEYGDHASAYAGLLARASERGFALFQLKLVERSEPGRQIETMRGLYDLWIDAAEEAYAEAALTPEFRKVYGAMVNAQMRVKQLVHREIDDKVGELGLPTRAELDGAHRKIHAMQRELRALRELVRGNTGVADAVPSSTPRPRSKPVRAPKKASAPRRSATLTDAAAKRAAGAKNAGRAARATAPPAAKTGTGARAKAKSAAKGGTLASTKARSTARRRKSAGE
jgi:polyhydroxyalkanoate synthase subunit PhaE